jgi:hypothetical protein
MSEKLGSKPKSEKEMKAQLEYEKRTKRAEEVEYDKYVEEQEKQNIQEAEEKEKARKSRPGFNNYGEDEPNDYGPRESDEDRIMRNIMNGDGDLEGY